ncbi:MAG TPA: response regulator [Noviherbaspirillum sp.]
MNAEQLVFVVDDDEAVRDALKMLLVAAGLKVETHVSAASFIKHYRAGQPGCLVLDIRMPGMSGLALQEDLERRKVAIPVVFLTGHADVPMAVRAMKLGAFDFIEKPIDSQRLVLAVMHALRSDAEQRARKPYRVGADGNAPGKIEALSGREREVLELVLQGRQTREIAAELSISIKTVEFHRARIREKLGVASLAELFRLFPPR